MAIRSNKPQNTEFKTWNVQEDQLLFDFVQYNCKDISRNKLKSYLQKKLICVNNRPVTKYDFQLRKGMKVSLMRKSNNPLEGNSYVRIVYEDAWILIINKNTGVLSMQSDHHSFCVKTLLDEYLKRKRSLSTAHVVHRLDRDTSGLMIFAKNSKVQQTLENNWHNLVHDRRYVAVVSGNMEQPTGTIESWLKDDKFFYTHSSPVDNGGKYAITHYRTLKATSTYSLVELKLETGRKNQIRVHMQDLNHPVVGDMKYGYADIDPIHRLALHAFRLFFIHPVTGKPMEFETPIPTAFKQLVNYEMD